MNKIFLKRDVARSFNNAAKTYDDAAVLQREVADRLLERLEFINISPNLILDLGSGTGYATRKLEKKYKKAKVVALDIAEQMLQQAKGTKQWFNRKHYTCAEAEQLPFNNQTFDLIFSSLMLHWSNIEQAFAEISRVLKPGGLLLFSALGPDTLYELRQSWSQIDSFEHVHKFLDMHILGDCLQKSGFKDPVMDMEFITITYNELKKIFLDLKDLGTHNIAQNRNKGLMGKKKFQQFVAAYETHRNSEGYIPVTYEVIYGIGWGQVKEKKITEYSVPIDSITRK